MACLGMSVDASAQLGALVSPGRLSRPHAALEGVGNCLSCHTAGRQVSATKCLTCHKPVAQRIAQKAGVHRNVTTDCVACHVEHAGIDGELRPFDQRRFNHATDTRFPLDGVHAAATCAGCHKTRSFLTAESSCVSCHADPHTPTLGTRCETCHTTTEKFVAARTRFDHSRTSFRLTGAHVKVMCAGCHVNKVLSGLKFAACSDCHSDPHSKPMGTSCASCHTTATWRTQQVDHSRTAFPLVGRHAPVDCVKCHTRPALEVKPRAGTCAACHTDPHSGVFKQDCASCHTESGFQKGTFDHSTTRFPLLDKHSGLSCAACHKGATGSAAVSVRPIASPIRPAIAAPQGVQDFRGLSTTCVSCHTDIHRGELGVRCEQCHTARTFEVTTFTHAQNRPFFEGEHRTVACAKCHATPAVATPTVEPVSRVGFTGTATTCVSCHRDVHLGQVGSRCESCHTVDGARFAVVGFSHDKTTFPLTGKHTPLVCDACHKVETRDFPAGRGAARRLTGIGTDCLACHTDPHAGQLGATCQTCHTVQAFAVSPYTHRNQRSLGSFFVGKHLGATCSACHKPTTIGASRTPVVSYRTTTACATCHTDVHRGALGPDCASCHRL
jgi:hypothetical protein